MSNTGDPIDEELPWLDVCLGGGSDYHVRRQLEFDAKHDASTEALLVVFIYGDYNKVWTEYN
jgi:hypothetical protein